MRAGYNKGKNPMQTSGQRITNVVNTLTLIEDMVDAMIKFWGVENIDDVDPSVIQNIDGDDAQFNGPARKDECIDRGDSDELFD